ncbi:MAG: beta strand repeat-containing protein, partial [Planctomyces sp.]
GAAGSGNNFFGNGAAGIAYDLTGFATGQINALNNNIQGQNRGLNFLINGDTFGQPFSLTNTSAQLDITRLQLNIAPSGNIWDTTTADPGNAAVPFQPLANTDVTTGLQSVNGTLIAAGSNPLTAAGGGALTGGGVADATALLDLQFNSFGVSEEFRWDIDSDPVGLPDGTVLGNDLIGSTIQLQFSDGSNLAGALQAVAGNPDAAQFVASSGASTADGIVLRGQGNSVFLASDINNNRIDRNGRWGIDVEMLGSARANDLDLKANTVTNNGLGGVRLHADGPGAFIDASQTIGGTGTVNLGFGNIVNAANQFNNNTGDGLRVHAENGGVIRGNVINNQIRDNTGNGINMIADRGANLDFGTAVAPPASRVISGNTISGNDGAGIQLTSNVSATTANRVDATLRGNTITGNDRGGVMSVQSGTNTNAPVAPAVSNNTVNLTVGGAAVADANTITGNGDAGVGVSVAGNGIANVTIRNATITGTTNGPDPILNGDGINLRRADSSLLTATIEDVTATGNAGDGLDVEVTGNDKNDPNQPLPGTRNTVTWNRNNLSTNGQNGARFRTRAESMLIADGTTNTL